MRVRVYLAFVPLVISIQILSICTFLIYRNSTTFSYFVSSIDLAWPSSWNTSVDMLQAYPQNGTPNTPGTAMTFPRAPCGYMTHLRFFGMGLGNLMFLYASIQGIAYQTNRIAVIDPDHLRHMSEIFDLPSSGNGNGSTPDLSPLVVRYSGVCCKYNPSILALPCGEHTLVHGYLQSYKYFQGINTELRKHFRFLRNVTAQCQRKFATATKSVTRSRRRKCVKIGVHLRRGDFTEKPQLEHGHMPAKFGYLQRAVTFYEAKFGSRYPCLLFVVLGNDADWNRRAVDKLNASRISAFSVLEQSDQGVDMCVLSKCNHMIVSTGTFGWWAAYLAGGIVTYQAEYARRGSRHFGEIARDDYFLPGWTPL